MIIFVITKGSNSSRFEESVEQLKKVLLDPKLIYVPVCIIANKQDLKDAITEEKVKEVILFNLSFENFDFIFYFKSSCLI